MGICRTQFDEVDKLFQEYIWKNDDKDPPKCIQLGEQQFSFDDPAEGIFKLRLAKHYLRSIGFICESIDMGTHPVYRDSWKMDLGAPLPPSVIGEWDLLTDFGTSEHVRDQYMCWKNSHDLTKIGGFRIHAIPLVGNWPGHCKFRYGLEFFEELARTNQYEVLDLKSIGKPGYQLVFCMYQHIQGVEFMTREEFEKIEIDVEPGFVDLEAYVP